MHILPVSDTVFDVLRIRAMEIGRGSFGVVFGPFSKANLRRLLPLADVQLTRGPFIIKVIESSDCPRDVGHDERVDRLFATVPKTVQDMFIRPVIVGCTPQQKLEVQRFGGAELFNEIHGSPKWKSSDVKTRKCLHSLVQIMKACLRFLKKKGVFLSDMKSENMVMNDKGVVSVIDFNVVPVADMPTNFVRTAFKDICPVQMYWMIGKNGGGQRFLQKYKRGFESIRQLEEAQAHLRNARNIPPARIAELSIVWVIAHTIRDVLRYKCTDASAFVRQFETDVLQPLYTMRYNMSGSDYTRLIERFLSASFPR